jgi:putative endopeptidase
MKAGVTRLLPCLGAAVVMWVMVASARQPGSGLDRASFDAAIRPQDDLYGHVNAGWFARTDIPPDRVSHNSFTELDDKVERDIHSIITEIAARPVRRDGSPEQQIADLYRSLTDEATIEAQGAAPLRPQLARIAAITDTTGLAAEAGRLSAIAAGGPFAGTIALDPHNPQRLIVEVTQGGILLPERDHYFRTDARSSVIRAGYEQYLETIFRLIDRANPGADATAVLALERELAALHGRAADARDPRRFTFAQLSREMPGFDWNAWGRPQGMTQMGSLILAQPSFFTGFAALVPARPLDTWKLWLAARYITWAAPFVSDAFGNARFEFFGRLLTGQEAPRPRWKRGVGLANGYLGDAVGRRYVEQHFPASSKARIDAIVSRVRAALRRSIDEAEWLAPATRRAALDKLSKLRTRIGYPDEWRDYRGLVIRPDDLLGNVQRAMAFDDAARMRRVNGQDNPRQWPLPPQTVNAAYAPASNEMMLPAALLQPPFFDAAADEAVNYGAIGGVVAHELGHGFDARGRRIDGDGAERDWWKPEDERAFTARAGVLAAQFREHDPIDGARVNGFLTLSENVCDLGGLAVAYRAYQLALGGKPAAVIDGLTGEQRFFMGWARVWRTKVRNDYVRQMLLTDPHAPARFRVNGPASNLMEFHEAFGVKPGDMLYREPAQRVRIW